MRLLVVEDEKDMNHILVSKLEKEGYNVDYCFDGDAAIDYLTLADYDGVILDIMLPGLDGFQVLKKLRAAGKQTPVLFLSARGDTEDIVRGLDTGADDYIVKPFVFKELLARIKVMTRRKPEIQENVYRCGDLTVDYNTHEVTRNGISITLSPKEFAVLLYLVRNKNIIVTREQIESNIWKLQSEGSSNLVDVYIRYLRRKIDEDFEEKMICTIRGTGYMLKCEE
ncbi:MAG: response regulator transcription factor [Dorea sp.]|jgi:two-component system copper resistance phosphate regulon response regulator CusR|nr:response regulator transcription factor [Dorea sp.]MCI9248183.1 response regulator transcription factor [Dorea sp.]